MLIPVPYDASQVSSLYAVDVNIILYMAEPECLTWLAPLSLWHGFESHLCLQKWIKKALLH